MTSVHEEHCSRCTSVSFRAVHAVLAMIMLALAGTRHAAGQALPTAKQPLRLYAYGAAAVGKTDYFGSHSGGGFLLGGLLNAEIRRRTELGLDARLMRNSSSDDRVNQTTISGGPRLSYQYGALQPYIAYCIGYGRMGFPKSANPKYTSDNSAVLGPAAGLNLSVTRSWSVFAEYTDQRWKLDDQGITFRPHFYSFGIRFEFESRGDGPGL